MRIGPDNDMLKFAKEQNKKGTTKSICVTKIIFYFCFVAHAADIWKVFSPGPNLKMWQFSVAKDNEQHSFLV